MPPLYIGILLAYLLGSVPTALIAGYILGRVDIRTTGSKNAGATNLYRTFGLKPYLVVLCLDILKGFAATKWIAIYVATDAMSLEQVMIVCGLASVFGHIFTIFAKFKGGKGVATAAGVMLAIVPVPLILALAVYFVVTSITHYVSLGSISASISLPLICLAGYYGWGVAYSLEVYSIVVLLAVLIIVTHRTNISRLIKGEENKTYFFGKPKE